MHRGSTAGRRTLVRALTNAAAGRHTVVPAPADGAWVFWAEGHAAGRLLVEIIAGAAAGRRIDRALLAIDFGSAAGRRELVRDFGNCSALFA